MEARDQASLMRRGTRGASVGVLALPANAEVTVEDRIELARRFALEYFVSRGLAVQLDVHAPHVGDMSWRWRQVMLRQIQTYNRTSRKGELARHRT